VTRQRGRIWLLAAVMAAALGCTTTTKTTSSTLTTSSPEEKSRDEKRQDALANYVQVGMGYIGQRNREQARLNLLRALEIDQRSPAAHNGMALLYQLERDPERAEDHFRKALRYDRNFTPARNNYGVFLASMERYPEALEQFRAAAGDVNYSLRPQVFLSLGVVAARLGRAEEARDAWERAIALDPAMGAPYLELAEYHFKRADYPLAKQYLAAHGKRAKPSARSLWLEVRVEAAFGDTDALASKGLALRKLFPYAPETLEYQQWVERRGRQ
jgi:type IV pilus assembly protein PilF